MQAQAEQRKTAANLDKAAGKVAGLEKEVHAHAEHSSKLRTQVEAQADELSKLQEERATQRILLPPGMEEEFDAPMPAASPRKASDTASSDIPRSGAAAGGGGYSLSLIHISEPTRPY